MTQNENKPAAAPIENAELASVTRMFHAACHDLGLINEALGLDPDDGGAAPILDAIAELKRERDQWVDANYAAAATAPAPADERAAFEECIRKHSDPDRFDDRIARQDGHYVEYATALAWAAWQARASSANETGAEGAKSVATVRVTNGGYGMELSTHVAYALPEGHHELYARAPAQAAGPVAIPAGWKLVPCVPTAEMINAAHSVGEIADPFDMKLAILAAMKAAPQPPAQADAREGLTATHFVAKYGNGTIEYSTCVDGFDLDWAETRGGVEIVGLVEVDDCALLAAHPGQPEPHASAGVIAAARAVIEADRAQTLTSEHVNALDNAIKIQHGVLTVPEPRAEVSSDVQRDGTRWRTLMKNGEPEVFVERTQRRAIQRTQPVAFSSPNLTGADRFDIPSEMWIKRYVMFAWWARENEHRKFVEAVDAISAGDIQ